MSFLDDIRTQEQTLNAALFLWKLLTWMQAALKLRTKTDVGPVCPHTRERNQ